MKGYKKGGKKAKKDNEVHQEEAGMWNMYGNRLSGGRMLRSRMIGFDSTTQSKQRSGDRLENERTGKTPRRDRSGVGKGKGTISKNELLTKGIKLSTGIPSHSPGVVSLKPLSKVVLEI